MDFSGGKTGHRSKHQQQQGKTEQVVKAAALPKRRAADSTPPADATNLNKHGPSSSNDGDDHDAAPLPLLWDLTAGLGTDAFLLAQAGWRVEMFERSPVVAALVQVCLLWVDGCGVFVRASWLACLLLLLLLHLT